MSTNPYKTVLAELEPVMDRIDDASVEGACAHIAAADKVVLYGCGREGLQIRGFAMRLHHLGCRAAMVGDMTTPPVGKGDLFIVSAGPGELATASALAGIAKGAGAKILFITARPQASLAAIADQTLVIPAQTMANDRDEGASALLPMGSVFEGAMFVVFEVMILKLRHLLGVSAEAMRARHTNME